MADLLGSDFGLAEAHKLYACLLLAHKDALFSHLTERWRDLRTRPRHYSRAPHERANAFPPEPVLRL
jgi:hypothetical protein